MRLITILLCTALIFTTTATCFAKNFDEPKLTITVDYQSAQLISNLMTHRTVTNQQIDEAEAAFGSQQLIKKVKSYSSFGADVFKSTLQEIITTGTIKGNDPYNWQAVKANLPQIRNLIKNLMIGGKTFPAEISAIIQSFTPAGISGDVKVCFIVGGGSLGFTYGGEHTFYVALQKIGDDMPGLKYLAAHELYHIVQGLGQATRSRAGKQKVDPNLKAAYALAYNLWTEGTATLAGDFTEIKNPALFAKTQIDEYKKNADRKNENFYLFDAMMYKIRRDTSADYEKLYNIGFSTGYDESSYYVGYEMAKKIVAYQGKPALANLMTQDPIVFMDTYIKLYQSHKNDHFIKFDSSTEQIVSELMQWKDKIF